MVEALVIIAGALSRRLVGWGGCPRWPGLVLAAIASGSIYWAAKKYAPSGPDGGFYDGWVSAAELGLGACLVGGLAVL